MRAWGGHSHHGASCRGHKRCTQARPQHSGATGWWLWFGSWRRRGPHGGKLTAVEGGRERDKLSVGGAAGYTAPVLRGCQSFGVWGPHGTLWVTPGSGSDLRTLCVTPTLREALDSPQHRGWRGSGDCPNYRRSIPEPQTSDVWNSREEARLKATVLGPASGASPAAPRGTGGDRCVLEGP